MSRFLLLGMLMSCAHHAPAEQHGHHGGMPHRFDNAEEWAKTFEDPERDAWQKPDDVVAALKLAPDAVVADIGAATGYFPVRLARAVPKGRVYGVDIEQSMVDYLTARAKKEGLTNLAAVLGTAEDPQLPESVDVVLVVDTYHHIENRPAYFARLAKKLKAGARLAIVDFKKDSPMGPPPEMRLLPEEVQTELEKAGYVRAASHAFLPQQYFLVFTR
jgi:cyclopropane fatty-acyl-phospholipid synthase-like methyltransferase